MLTPANKNTDYSGPIYHKTIIAQIYREAQEEGRDVSLHVIDIVILSLFSKSIGITYYIRNGKNLFISGLGKFLVTKKLKKKREVIKEKQRIKRAKLFAWEQKKRYRKCRLITKVKEHLPIFDELNRQYREKGWKEWTWRQYCTVNKMTTCIVLYKTVREEDQKKLDLMRNGIFKKGDIVKTKDGRTMMFYCNYGTVTNGFNRPRMTCFVCPITKVGKPNIRYWGNGGMMTVVFNDELSPNKS